MSIVQRIKTLTAASLLGAFAIATVGATAPSAQAISLCGAKIASANWAYNSAGPGYTLHVNPTGCGRATSASDPGTAFDQAISKATGIPAGHGHGWDPNRGSLLEQFECHARSIGIFKSTWNLDAWRPQVSWLTEIRDRCNPPGPSSGSSTPAPGTSPPPTSAPPPTSSAPASGGPVFTVMNTSETLPDGIWFRTAPYMADTERITGLGPYMNEQVELHCYWFGEAVGPYSDSLWYQVTDISRPVVDGLSNSGWLNAHFVNDGKVANEVDAGVPAC